MLFFVIFAKLENMKHEDIEILGKLLDEAGKNKSDLARAWGRHPTAATSLFKSNRQLKLEEIDKTAVLLGMSTTELVGKLRGEKIESYNDELYALALQRAYDAMKRMGTPLKPREFAEYVYLLYKLALSEKRTEGEAYLTQGSVELLLKQMLQPAN